MEQIDEYKQIRRIHITTTITTDLKDKCETANPPIKLSEALRVGIGVLLAERGDDSYTGALNVYRKLNALRTLLEETSEKLNKVTDKWIATYNTLCAPRLRSY